MLANVKHWRFVFRALANDDDAIHLECAKHVAHAVYCRLVGGVFVAASHPARGVHRRGFSYAHKLEREISIDRSTWHWSIPPDVRYQSALSICWSDEPNHLAAVSPSTRLLSIVSVQ